MVKNRHRPDSYPIVIIMGIPITLLISGMVIILLISGMVIITVVNSG